MTGNLQNSICTERGPVRAGFEKINPAVIPDIIFIRTLQ